MSVKRNNDFHLVSLDELFTTEEERQDAKKEKVEEIPLDQLHPFKDHPFKVVDDDAMAEMVESIRENGVKQPCLARPLPDGGYELISGHRRLHASQLAGKETLPVIVREMTDDEAVIAMVDTNLHQRQELLPSERAFAYKMRLEAMNRQGQRTDLTCSQVGNKLKGQKSSEQFAEELGISKNQVFRYVHLCNLLPDFLDMIDRKAIGINPAYEISFLADEEQFLLLDAIDSEQATPSLSQAQRIKRFSQEGKLNADVLVGILSEEKKGDLEKVTISQSTLRKYFPESYTPRQMEDTILHLLDQWHKNRNHNRDGR